MSEFEIHISGLAGPLCVVHAGEDWRLLDLHKAVAASTAIPTDCQRLISGATILEGSSQLLSELLQRGFNQVLCVRSQQWVEVPYYSGDSGASEGSLRLECQRQGQGTVDTCKAIEEVKARCLENDELWGFTLRSGEEHVDSLRDLRFKHMGTQLGHNSRTGTTFVKLTPAGRAVLLNAIRVTRGTKREIIQAITDLDTILSAVEENAAVFRHACKDLRCNLQVAEVAVLANPFVLRYAPDDVKDNAEIVRQAIERNPFALQYASERLKSDRGIVLLAINSEPSTIRYASKALQADRDLCLTALRRDGNVLRHLTADLRDNAGIVLVAVDQQGQALCFASRRLRADKVVVAAAVRSDPAAVEYACPGSSL